MMDETSSNEVNSVCRAAAVTTRIYPFESTFTQTPLHRRGNEIIEGGTMLLSPLHGTKSRPSGFPTRACEGTI